MDVNASGSDLVPSTADIDSTIAGNVIEASLAKRIKKRGALRGSATKLRNRVSERLDDETAPADMFYLKDKIQRIKQKIESLNKLDDEIIDLMASCHDEEVEGRIEMDIEASDLVQTELNAIVNRMCTWTIVASAQSTNATTTTTDASSKAKSRLLIS